MATQSQVAANQANAQKSTGPTSPEGKAASSLNNFRHGFTGEFTVLGWENQDLFDALNISLWAEHKPQTVTEKILIEKMAQYIWLGRRAINLQQDAMGAQEMHPDDRAKLFALYLRYQTTNDRGFHKCLDDLLKLRAEKRKEQIGFESQRRLQAEELRREANEKRKQDTHKMRIWLLQAEGEHRELKNSALDTSRQGLQPRIERILAHEKAA